MSEALRQLFAPNSVAILGASNNNPWARLVVGTLRALDFPGHLHLVNRRGEQVLGLPTVTDMAAIGQPVDSAFVMVPAAAMEQTFREMAEAGIRSGVVVTSGFAEIGHDGAAEQARLFDLARSLGLTLMGPNSLGFINLVDRVSLSAIPVQSPILASPRIGVVSQSGATAGVLANTAHATNVSLSHIIAVGNEAMVDTADAIDFMVDCPSTRVILVFAESVRRPDAFRAAASRALERNKPIVILKVGVGELAAKVAQAHTGSLVGDNRVFDAACRDLGMVRVDTLEQMLQTANMLAHTGVLGEGGLAVASLSGGACEMVADLGDAAGVSFAEFSSTTKAKLAELLPPYATVQNPLDVTGGLLSNFKAFGEVTRVCGDDDGVAIVAASVDIAVSAEAETLGRPAIGDLAQGLRAAKVPAFLMPQCYQSVTAYARETLEVTGIPLCSAGMGHAMKAVAAAQEWSAKARAHGGATDPITIEPADRRPSNERETLDFLASRDVPVVPGRVACNSRDARAFAAELGGPVVLKILSTDIAHKTEVGGVALNIAGPMEAAAEFEAMMTRVARAKPNAGIDGIIVSPMRPAALELLVGVARDPVWGLVLAVGLGGIWVEALGDVDLSLLPVKTADVEAMLGRLRGRKLLDGFRGQPPVDRKRVAEVVAAIGNAAIALGPDLLSLEVNPLRASGSEVECLDALAIWAQRAPPAHAGGVQH